jgi:hypothetical protein
VLEGIPAVKELFLESALVVVTSLREVCMRRERGLRLCGCCRRTHLDTCLMDCKQDHDDNSVRAEDGFIALRHERRHEERAVKWRSERASLQHWH